MGYDVDIRSIENKLALRSELIHPFGLHELYVPTIRCPGGQRGICFNPLSRCCSVLCQWRIQRKAHPREHMFCRQKAEADTETKAAETKRHDVSSKMLRNHDFVLPKWQTAFTLCLWSYMKKTFSLTDLAFSKRNLAASKTYS